MWTKTGRHYHFQVDIHSLVRFYEFLQKKQNIIIILQYVLMLDYKQKIIIILNMLICQYMFVF